MTAFPATSQLVENLKPQRLDRRRLLQGWDRVRLARRHKSRTSLPADCGGDTPRFSRTLQARVSCLKLIQVATGSSVSCLLRVGRDRRCSWVGCWRLAGAGSPVRFCRYDNSRTSFAVSRDQSDQRIYDNSNMTVPHVRYPSFRQPF